jgi:hypothetical protein
MKKFQVTILFLFVSFFCFCQNSTSQEIKKDTTIVSKSANLYKNGIGLRFGDIGAGVTYKHYFKDITTEFSAGGGTLGYFGNYSAVRVAVAYQKTGSIGYNPMQELVLV